MATSKLPVHDSKKVPDPSPDCPRCHYWEQKARSEAESGSDRIITDAWPLGIDQTKAQELLQRAFPQKQRSYG